MGKIQVTDYLPTWSFTSMTLNKKVLRMKRVSGVTTFVFLFCMAFCFAAVSGAPAGSGYTLKKGIVYLDGEKQECDLQKVAPDIGGKIRYWAVFADEDKGEAVVCFFPSDGAGVAYLSIEGVNACQGIFFSPDGKRFLLMEGSGIRLDMTYALYEFGEWGAVVSLEKKVEIAGIRENVKWIDPMRFVMTRIDDLRGDGEVAHGAAWRLSTVLYNTAVSETIVLKSATGTQNYVFDELVENGKVAMVLEESVTSKKDWSDAKKYKRRAIKVEIPAAR